LILPVILPILLLVVFTQTFKALNGLLCAGVPLRDYSLTQ